MRKLNCWEFMKCGREPGGDNTNEAGICPVAEETFANGLNRGVNGGRLCWIIAGNYNSGRVNCFNSKDKLSCPDCEFYRRVMKEEGLLNICRTTGFYLIHSGCKQP